MEYQVQTCNWAGQKGWVGTGGIQPRNYAEAIKLRDSLSSRYPTMAVRSIMIQTIESVID